MACAASDVTCRRASGLSLDSSESAADQARQPAAPLVGGHSAADSDRGRVGVTEPGPGRVVHGCTFPAGGAGMLPLAEPAMRGQRGLGGPHEASGGIYAPRGGSIHNKLAGRCIDSIDFEGIYVAR